ncbi:hypothetical protein EAI28_23965, partial [Faecalicatena contorta]|uniref:hypothetical protein n=2 Tax=Clostridia TaxID=186801 RepID=UPI001A9B0538
QPFIWAAAGGDWDDPDPGVSAAVGQCEKLWCYRRANRENRLESVCFPGLFRQEGIYILC